MNPAESANAQFGMIGGTSKFMTIRGLLVQTWCCCILFLLFPSLSVWTRSTWMPPHGTIWQQTYLGLRKKRDLVLKFSESWFYSWMPRVNKKLKTISFSMNLYLSQTVKTQQSKILRMYCVRKEMSAFPFLHSFRATSWTWSRARRTPWRPSCCMETVRVFKQAKIPIASPDIARFAIMPSVLQYIFDRIETFDQTRWNT